MDADHDLRFVLLAHQRGIIDAGQFAEVCAAWSGDKRVSPARIMLDRRWITSNQIDELQTVLERPLEQRDGEKSKASNDPAASETPDLDPNAAHKRLSRTDELPGPRMELPSESKKRATKHDNVTQADDPKAATEPQSRTVDFSAESQVAEPEPEKTDGSNQQSTGHVRKASLETVEHKFESRSHYTLSRVHGKGGLGQVWLAIDSELNREVALKEVLPEKGANSDTCSRLVKEAQITGQLEHPNIIPVYELTRGSNDEPPFYTMRFMRGRTLHERIREYHERRRAGHADHLEMRQLLNILIGVCNALAYAHSRGVVHRDLKPQNVLLGDFGEVIVIDWGLAKMLNQPDDVSDLREIRFVEGAGLAATMEGKVLGTPAFTSPEQADGKVGLIDARSDIYGLGAILFMILTGHAPHRGTVSGNSFRDTMELLRQITSGPTPHARLADAAVPAALDAICAKAMAKERVHRYAKAAELTDDIQRWLGDEPVSAYRDPWRDRLLRWVRRHRVWTQAAAAALVVVTLVSSVATVFVNRARRQVEKSLVVEQTALASEREARAEATRRFKEARDAVDKSLTGVSGVLVYYPGVEPLRRELLKRAAADYERFASEKSDDVELRAESGRAFIRLGDVRHLLLEQKESETAYHSAEALFEELHRIEPENPEYELDLAHARSRLGSLFTAVGQLAAAERAFDAAIRSLDDLTQRHAGSREFRYEKAVASLNRIALLKKFGRLTEALAVLEQVEQELNRLTLEDHDSRFAETFADARRQLGQTLGLMGREVEAVSRLQEAIIAYSELVQGRLDHPPYLEGLAFTRVDLANALRALGRDAEVIKAYRTSISDFEDLLHARPEVPYYRENLALSRTNLAQVLNTSGRNAEAKSQCMAGLNEFVDLVNRSPEVDQFHEEHATASATFGLILRDLNDNDLAAAAFRGSIEVLGALVAKLPEAQFYRSRLAIARTSLARTLHKAGQLEAAKLEFLTAIEGFQGVLRHTAGDLFAQDGLAWSYTHLGSLLAETGESRESFACYANVLAMREKLDQQSDHLFNLAWFLVNCDDAKFRDPERAIRVADEARTKAPENARYWNMFGTAQFRAGNWAEAIKSLLAAVELRQTNHAADWFVLAMARWQNDEKEEARVCFEKGIKFMDEHCPGNIDVGKLRHEAAGLLGIAKQADSVEKPPTTATSSDKK